MNAKLATPKFQSAEIEPIWANPEFEPFLRMRFLNLFFPFHVPEVLEWKIAHSLWYKKAQNTGKSPKNDCVTSLRNLQDVSEHPVYVIYAVYAKNLTNRV